MKRIIRIAKKFSCLFIIVGLFFASFSEVKSQNQDYKRIQKIYTNVYIADSLYEIKDYKNAVKFYKKAKDGYYYKAMMLSQIARCYLALGDSLQTSKYYKKIPPQRKEENNINKELRAEFLKRKETDQMYRGLLAENDSLWKIQKKYDRENQLFLDSVINKYGWAGISLIGQDGAGIAFLIAQHADLDLKFQEKCLKFMKKALKKNDVVRCDFAYLMDRVMLKKYGFQLFASQCMEVDGTFQSRPLYDEKILKTLRKYFWMPPIEEYLKFMQNKYGKKNERNVR
jgi:hypothetical protein